ncbi:MAG: hypothetical protein V1706_05990 [Pseudomonadota bacterium]
MRNKSFWIGLLLATVLFLATGFGGGTSKYSAFFSGKGYSILNNETGVLKTFIPGEKNNFFTVEVSYEKETFKRKIGQIENNVK